MNINNLHTQVISSLADKGLLSIKTSFEDEGADFVDVLSLKTYCDRNNIPLVLKIAGGEAIRDIKDANKLHIKKLVAPMLESKFAFEKFVQSCHKHYLVPNGTLAINVESQQCYDNLDSILTSTHIKALSSITVGRGDLVQSFDMDRYGGSVNSDKILNITRDVFSKAKKLGLSCTLGGSMTTDSSEFVLSLVESSLLDSFETRNVIFHKDALNYYGFDKLITEALSFELNYLCLKRDYYNTLYTQDVTRIQKLSKNAV